MTMILTGGATGDDPACYFADNVSGWESVKTIGVPAETTTSR